MTENSEPNVGLRLRTLREQRGFSMRALAERCGLSINAISQIERGENSPTVATLHRLSTALNANINVFFNDESKQRVIIVRRNTGLRSQSNGVLMESLGIGLFDQQLEPFCLTIEPGAGNIEDPISHAGEEFVHCLEGKVEYLLGGNMFLLDQGDSLLFEAKQPHAYRNVTGQPATILVVYQSTQNGNEIRQLHIDY